MPKKKKNMPEPKKADLADRTFKTYLPPLYAKLTHAYVDYVGDNESRSVAGMVKKFFDNMAPEERERLLRDFGNQKTNRDNNSWK